MSSIYQKEIGEFHNYPAYRVIELDTARSYEGDQEAINLKDGDELYELTHGTKHMIGSVASSCIKKGSCPMKGIERAKEHGHDLHFIFGLGSCLTAHDVPQGTLIGVRIGQKINFEGRTFKIIEQWNRNIGLEEITE